MTSPTLVPLVAVVAVAILFCWRCTACLWNRYAVMRAASLAATHTCSRTAPDVRLPHSSAATCCDPDQDVAAEYQDEGDSR